MWIRSQDLFTLVKCERLSIRQCASDSFDVIGDECIVLGEYSTLDKALRVLDEIQTIFESKQFCVVDNVDLGNYVLHNGVQVYQMPQDEDVVE